MDRVKKAVDYFMSGYNCAQSVFCAFCDLFDIDEQKGRGISSGFGGGMAGMRGICGAISAGVMLMGLKYGNYDVTNNDAKTEFYERIRLMHCKFIERFGTTTCKNLLENADVEIQRAPSERTQQYYKTRPCVMIVEYAAEIIDQYFKSNK